MNGKKIIKPFDLEAAKNGAKIETRDGREVEILKWDAENTSYPIEGVILRSKSTWANDGKWSIADPQHCHNDLVIVEDEGSSELAESKGEKIRKILCGWVSAEPDTTFKEGCYSKDEILAWLGFKRCGTCWVEEPIKVGDWVKKKDGTAFRNGWICAYVQKITSEGHEGRRVWFGHGGYLYESELVKVTD